MEQYFPAIVNSSAMSVDQTEQLISQVKSSESTLPAI